MCHDETNEWLFSRRNEGESRNLGKIPQDMSNIMPLVRSTLHDWKKQSQESHIFEETLVFKGVSFKWNHRRLVFKDAILSRTELGKPSDQWKLSASALSSWNDFQIHFKRTVSQGHSLYKWIITSVSERAVADSCRQDCRHNSNRV